MPAVQPIELRSDHLADVPTVDLIRREPEELHVRAVGEAVAQVDAVIADHRRQRVQDRSGVLNPAGQPTVGDLAERLGVGRHIISDCLVCHVLRSLDHDRRANLPVEA